MRYFVFIFGCAVAILQEPEIDWSSEEGETPDNLDGNIKFSDVVFNYPARPDVQVCHELPHYFV